jgi:hypothetical protein
MSGRNQVLDSTRTIFLRTTGTRLGSGTVSAADLDPVFQSACGVCVTGCRRISNGLIVELLNAADKEKCVGLYVVVRGLRCRVHTHVVRTSGATAAAAATTAMQDNKHDSSQPGKVRPETVANPVPQLQRAATTTTTAVPTTPPVADPIRVINDALLALDSHRATPQATVAALAEFKSLPAFPPLLVKSSSSAELVRLLCADDNDFRDRFADALLQEFLNELFARARESAAIDSDGSSVAIAAFATGRLASVARLVGSLAGSRVLSSAEVLRAMCLCVPNNSSSVPTCYILALCVMTENMTGAPAALLGDCVERLQRTETFVPPPSISLAVELRRVCRTHGVSPVAANTALRPLAHFSSAAPLPLVAAPPAVAVSRGAVTSTTRGAPPRVDAEYVRVFGAALAAAHGARLRQAALDTAALLALLEFAPRDRVAIFEGLGIPLGQAVQLATALVRNLRRHAGGGE